MAKYRLISLDLCPFVQRTQVILREKGVDIDVDYVDLSSKPDWFLALSPTEKVPTLEVTTDDGEQVILFESLVINEYLEEAAVGTGGPPGTLPHDDRARPRRLSERDRRTCQRRISRVGAARNSG